MPLVILESCGFPDGVNRIFDKDLANCSGFTHHQRISMTSVAFIGAGNIAQAIIGGFSTKDESAEITASDPAAEQLQKLPQRVNRTTDNREAVSNADVVVLCLKPDLMPQICKELSDSAGDKLFISVAAGITIASISSWLGPDAAIIRCMPNTPALVQRGMTGLCANSHVKEDQRTIAESILGAVGQIHWFEDESDLDVVTAISGSGPAYYFLVMQSMQQAGIALGLTPEVSRKLVLQTAIGAAQMAIESELSSEQLRINVTSPGGTTQAALEKLMDGGLDNMFDIAIKAAYERSKELSAT